jgi:hypothetical protein
MNPFLLNVLLLAAEKDFDENSVTPGWVGFAATFAVAAVTVLIAIDMVRRVRRVRYRGEIREKLESERAADDLPS